MIPCSGTVCECTATTDAMRTRSGDAVAALVVGLTCDVAFPDRIDQAASPAGHTYRATPSGRTAAKYVLSVIPIKPPPFSSMGSPFLVGLSLEKGSQVLADLSNQQVPFSWGQCA